MSYIRTPEIRKRISESLRGNTLSEKSRKKISDKLKGIKKPLSFGKKVSDRLKGVPKTLEHRKNLSKALTGRIIPDEVRKKISMTTKGRIGKPLSEETKLKIRLANLGRKDTPETKEKKRLKSLGVTHIVSAEARKKLSIAGKGRSPWLKGRKHRQESIEKMRQWRKNVTMPIKDTSIEVKIQNFLCLLGIQFEKHRYMKEIKHGYQCDVYVPCMNLVIECDGNYWHDYPMGTEIDHIRTIELKEKGFNVLRLWEHEIMAMNLNSFKEILDRR